MSVSMHVTLVTPTSEVKYDQVVSIVVKTAMGEIGVLPRHRHLLAQLANKGTLRVRIQDGQEYTYQIGEGVIEVEPASVRILTEHASLV